MADVSAAEGQLAEGQDPLYVPNSAPAIAAGASVFYHSFQDLTTDANSFLNNTPSTTIVMDAEETAGGLQWVLSYVPSSAVVYARPLLTSPVVPIGPMPATAASTTTNGVTVNTVSFDFPVPGPFPVGTYAFYAEVTVSGRIDVTSGIVVQVNPALGT